MMARELVGCPDCGFSITVLRGTDRFACQCGVWHKLAGLWQRTGPRMIDYGQESVPFLQAALDRAQQEEPIVDFFRRHGWYAVETGRVEPSRRRRFAGWLRRLADRIER